jgi:replicative DNA helicase
MDAPAGRVPASDLDAEAAVLSACLLDQSAYDKVQVLLQARHFYADANRRVYMAMQDLATKGSPIDVVSVAGVLRDHEKLQAVGGTPYLAQLSDATPAVANVLTHAQTIIDKWSIRQITFACQTIAIEGFGDIGEVANWKQSVDQRIYAVTRQHELDDQFSVLGQAAADEVRQVGERRKNKGIVVSGITTGLPTLDARIGGMKRGNKYVIGARPSAGKTGMLLNMLLAAARAGHGVVCVSLEMPRDQLALRALAQEANIDGHKLGMGRINDAQWKDLVGASVELEKLPIIIVDASMQTISTLRSSVRDARRRLKEKFGDHIEIGVVGIDYLQLMRVAPDVLINGDGELTAISQATMQLAKDEHCVVIECAQLNRDVEKEKDKRPYSHHFRGSGSIEQDAFGIFMIYREDMYRKEGEDKDNRAEILVRKIRNGGATGTVHCKFKPATATFYETSQNPDYEQLGDMFDDYLPGQSGEPVDDWHNQYDK